MLKLNSLRAVIVQAVPDLARDAENLIVIADEGALHSQGVQNLSFEYVYTARVIVQDYAGHTDALFLPVLAWAKRNQPELFENAERMRKGLQFRVEHLSPNTVDVGISIELTERVIVTADKDHPTRVIATHPEEPCHIGQPCIPEHWELWLRDEVMLAAWDILPPPIQDRFDVY